MKGEVHLEHKVKLPSDTAAMTVEPGYKVNKILQNTFVWIPLQASTPFEVSFLLTRWQPSRHNLSYEFPENAIYEKGIRI